MWLLSEAVTTQRGGVVPLRSTYLSMHPLALSPCQPPLHNTPVPTAHLICQQRPSSCTAENVIAVCSRQESDDEAEEDAAEDELSDNDAEAAGGDGEGSTSSDEDAKPWDDGSSDDVNQQIMRDLPAFTPAAQVKAPQFY